MTPVPGSPLDPAAALEAVLAEVRPLEAESVPLDEALGRTLASALASAEAVPAFDNSAMDGYAVRSVDTRGAAPGAEVRLRVTGESRAGAPALRGPGSGEAVQISTGAMLPEGADAVVRVEDTDGGGDGSVAVRVEVSPGAEVRRAGDDIPAGEVVLERGRRIGPAELGVAASTGATRLDCSRRPAVAVLSTGDELVEPGRPLGPGQIRNTNSFAVPAQAVAAGAAILGREIVPDRFEETVSALDRSLDANAVVITGGVSVGPHDHVKPALAALGVREVFWGVALRPGKPTSFGVRERSGGVRTLVFGLPGNPVSAMVTFHLFVRPALVAMQGGDPRGRRATAVMDVAYPKRPGRAHAVRCRLEHHDDGLHVRPTKAQGSHVLTSMLDADALALLPVEQGDVAAGERVLVELVG